MKTSTVRPSWLAPGQVATRKFPIVGERSPGEAMPPLADWQLVISGAVSSSRSFSWEDIQTFPVSPIVRDIHCVTGWSHQQMEFEGFPLALLLAQCHPLEEARFVRFIAYSERNHDTSLPLELALEDTWLVHRWNGEPLAPEHGYPLRSLTPSRYFYKSVKWLHRIELLTEDELGFWERDSSYHNNADPWKEERYTTGSMKPKEVERLREMSHFDKLRKRGKVILGADLRDWKPKSTDLRGLQLKNCDLRGAQLQGCDLRNANLTRSLFDKADLTGANLEGADLEGANLSGAILRSSNFNGTFLSATLFVSLVDGEEVAAVIEGMTWEGASGLLESQEAFLTR